MTRVVEPADRAEAAAALAEATAAGLRVRPRGGGTKLAWGGIGLEPDVELHTGRLDRIVEHNAGDLTAVLEAGVPLARAQELFGGAGQMLMLDPAPLPAATIGGLVATADSGPLRHRYGAVRDLVVGITVALSDGTVARAGGKVIKNVAGYDLAKLFAGSLGTLGLILEVAVRLHPLPPATATIVAATGNRESLARAAAALAHAPLELDSLDVRWLDGRGELLARFAGAAARRRAEDAVAPLGPGLEPVLLEGEEEDARWAAQRAGQRSATGTVLRVAAPPASLARVLEAADTAGAELVGRAGLGLAWLRLEDRTDEQAVAGVAAVRAALPEAHSWLLDAPAAVRERAGAWDATANGPANALMRRVKERFDPAGTCNPGRQVGGI